MTEMNNITTEELLELAEQKQFRRLKEILIEMNEVDVAEFMEELSSDCGGISYLAEGAGDGGFCVSAD